MEKILSHMPDNPGIKAEKFLEINTGHPVFATMVAAHEKNTDADKFAAMARVLYNQALLIEGLTVEDPVAFANDIWAIVR
jgi:molecular chaperone HtpG